MRKKILSIITIVLILLLLTTNVKAATNMLFVVQGASETKYLENEQGIIDNKIISSDNENGEITMKLSINNTKSNQGSNKKYENTEIFIIVDETIANDTEKLDTYKTYISKLSEKIFERNSNTKIGIIGMKGPIRDHIIDEDGKIINGPNDEGNIKGTADNAEIVMDLTNNLDNITNGIKTMNSDNLDYYYNFEASIKLAIDTYSDKVNKILISLYDNVPSTAIGIESQVTYGGILSDYNTVEEAVIGKHEKIVNNTKREILSLKKSNIDFIMLRPADTSFDQKWYDNETGVVNFEFDGSPYVEKLYGTLEQPTYGKMYSLDEESLEKIVIDNIYDDVIEKIGTDMKSVVAKCYFPKDIINNFSIKISDDDKSKVDITKLQTDGYIIWNIGDLNSNKSEDLEYTVKIKDMKNSELLNKLISINEEVEITYKNYLNNQNSIKLLDNPKVKLIEKTEQLEPDVDDKPNGSNGGGTNNKKDDTVAPGTIPQTGESVIILSSTILIAVIGIILFIKCKKDRDIK